MQPDFCLWLQNRGFDPATLSPQQVAYLEGCYAAERRDPIHVRIVNEPRSPHLDIRAAAASSLQLRAAALECMVTFEAAADATTTPRVSMTAYTGVPMKLPGFQHPVIVDLDSAKPAKGPVPFLRDHDPSRIAGHGDVEITPQRIRAAGPLSGLPEHTGELVHTGKGGFPWQASIGASAETMDFVPRGETVKVNGRNHTGPLHVARGATVREISLVPMGADGNTSAAVAASFDRGKPMKFKAWLQARSHDHATLTVERKAELKAEYRREYPKEPTPIPLAAPVPDSATLTAQLNAAIEAANVKARKEAAAEIGRQCRIRDICAADMGLTTEIAGTDGKPQTVNLYQHAIAANWSADQVELAVLRCRRPASVSPHFYSPTAPQLNDAVIEAAILQAGRCQLWDDSFYLDNQGRRRVAEWQQRETQRELNARYTDQVQQAAHAMFKGRIGLHQVLAAGAAINGRHVSEVIRDDDDLKKVLHAAFTPQLRADGASGASLGNVLANVLNKFLLTGYLMVERVWRDICAVRPTKDFKPTKSINLLADVVLKKVNADGQLQSGTIGDQAFANQVDTFGRILTITRQMSINDDLSALTTLPNLMGRGAGLAINENLWPLLLNPGNADDGVAFWSAAHTNSNLISGAGSTLTSAGLQLAEQTFNKQVDPKGKPLGVDPDILLVPPELSVPADELVMPGASGLVYGGASTAKQPNINVFRGKFRKMMSRYLSNTLYTGNSATAWYLLANPQIGSVIETAFLNGQENPTVQTAQADFATLGMSLRVFWDFGMNMQNFRFGVKSAGA